MNYLIDLLTTLDNAEREKVAILPVTGLQQTVLQMALQVAGKKRKAESFTPGQLKINRSHFDKTISLLRKRVYSSLAGDSFAEQASFLLNRGLSQLLLHEIIAGYKKLKTLTAKEQLRFYQTSFEAMLRMPFDVLDLKLLRKLANALQADSRHSESPTAVELKLIYVANAYQFFKGNQLKYRAVALKQIRAVAKNANRWKNKPELSHYHLCLGGYYANYEKKNELAIQHYRSAIENAAHCKPALEDRLLASLYGLLSNALSNESEFDEAFRVYRQAYELFPAILGASYYHNYMFALSAILCGKYTYARQHMNRHLKPFLDSHASLYYRFNTLRLYAIVNMYEGKPENAFIFIKQCLSLRKSEIAETGNIMLQMLQAIYFLLTGQYSLALNWAHKNQRILKRKGYTFDTCEYLHVFFVTGELAKLKQNRKADTKKIAAHLAVCRNGALKLYGGLLDLVQ